MDNSDELDETVISSSGRKRKIKAEMFSWNLERAARYNGEGKLCVLRVITSINLWSQQQQQRLSGIYILIWRDYKD